MQAAIERCRSYVDELLVLFGDELVSVVLYGSAARGHFHQGASDLNLLVLLRAVDPDVLRRGSLLARHWAEAGNPPPLFLGEAEWQRSGDVFPIEMEDMRDAHRVLWGRDPFVEVRTDREHLRLQCEHELKAKQIRLREHYLLVADNPVEVARLLRASFSTFLTLFRTVLRLADSPVPEQPEEVIRAVAGQAGWDPSPFLAVLEGRRGGAARPEADGPLASGYLAAVSRTTEWVDRFAGRT